MHGFFDKPFTMDRVVRLVISVILIFSGVYVVYVLKSVLLPFLIAWLIAYMLNPIVRFFQNKLRLRNRILSVVATLVSVVGVITLLIILLIPLIENEFYQINSLIHNYQLRSLNLNLNGIPIEFQEAILKYVDYNIIKESLSTQNASETIQKYVIPALNGVVSSTISILLGLTIVFVVLLYLVFILIDYEKINQLWRNLIPHKYRSFVMNIASDVERNMNNYFRHQFLICVILSVLYAIGFQIVGLPLAIMFGIFVGLLHMIPYLQVISFPPAMLLCWLKASQTDDGFLAMVGLVALVYLAVQCIMDLYLVPRIMGKAMGLNPAIILLSLSVWGYVMGIVGMIIAIPLTTLLLSYYQSFIESMLEDNASNPIEIQSDADEEKITLDE